MTVPVTTKHEKATQD